MGAQCNYFRPIKEWIKQILILFLNNLLFEKYTGQNELLICPNCTEGDKLVFTPIVWPQTFWQMKGWQVFWVNTNQAVPLQFWPLQTVMLKGSPLQTVMLWRVRIFSYHENYCFSETSSGPNQHWLDFTFRWNSDPMLGTLCYRLKYFPKNLHTILHNWGRLSVSLKQCLKPLIAPLVFLFYKNKNRMGIFTFGKILSQAWLVFWIQISETSLENSKKWQTNSLEQLGPHCASSWRIFAILFRN